MSKIFFKGGSFASANILGAAVGASRYNAERRITVFELETVERWDSGEIARRIPVYFPGQIEIAPDTVVSVCGALSIAEAKGGDAKYPTTFEVIRPESVLPIGPAQAGFCGQNRAILVGRVGKVRELNANGKNGLAVSVAVTRTEMDQEGNRSEVTDWHEALFWGKRAENAAKRLGTGDMVLLTGVLAVRQMKVGQDRKTLLGFTPAEFNVLQKKQAKAGGGAIRSELAAEAEVASEAAAPSGNGYDDGFSEDIPF